MRACRSQEVIFETENKKMFVLLYMGIFSLLKKHNNINNNNYNNNHNNNNKNNNKRIKLFSKKLLFYV